MLLRDLFLAPDARDFAPAKVADCRGLLGPRDREFVQSMLTVPAVWEARTFAFARHSTKPENAPDPTGCAEAAEIPS
jgi:hypothetical protein